MNALAQLIQKSRAPKTTYGEEQDACQQHHNVINGLPATKYADWDEAKEKFARKGRYER